MFDSLICCSFTSGDFLYIYKKKKTCSDHQSNDAKTQLKTVGPARPRTWSRPSSPPVSFRLAVTSVRVLPQLSLVIKRATCRHLRSNRTLCPLSLWGRTKSPRKGAASRRSLHSLAKPHLQLRMHSLPGVHGPRVPISDSETHQTSSCPYEDRKLWHGSFRETKDYG